MRLSLIILSTAVFTAVLFVAVRSSRAASTFPPLITVPHVDLIRYMGVWHEIARIDHSFQKGCIKSSATYTMLPDGEVEVINRCVNGKDGRLREAKGRAWSVDPENNARLKVTFFWPFRGDYWIIDLGKEYEYAVVGSPNRQYLWILARQPVMDDIVYKGILERLTTQGFRVEQLVR
ncbi:MAG: lipocalin family protein [Deltaproteobacteria bacterium]|nr:lipocalin family protein [Deltaproteobacteria bacterium]